jgi:hypothetical protein
MARLLRSAKYSGRWGERERERVRKKQKKIALYGMEARKKEIFIP